MSNNTYYTFSSVVTFRNYMCERRTSTPFKIWCRHIDVNKNSFFLNTIISCFTKVCIFPHFT